MDKEQLIKTLYENLYAAKHEREIAKFMPELILSKDVLKKFQIERLKVTHYDLLHSTDTRKATEFFFKELYNPKDLSKRDKDIEKMIPIMQNVFPTNILETVTKAIRLDALTEKLDNVMAKELGQDFSYEDYIKVYKEKTSKEDRLLQIELIESLGLALCELIHIPFISSTLKIMTIPARLANLQEMHTFLNEGFTTFKETKNPNKFITTLVNKEKQLLNDIYK